MSWLKDLVKNGSGVSSKSFFLVAITLLGCFLLLVVAFILTFEVIRNGMIQTDLNGLAIFVGSITTLFGTAGVTKCIGERNERKSREE